MLATAGLMLSAAAILVLVGIGKAQIAASEAKHANLFGIWWFDLGLSLTGVGLLWGAVAVAAIASQGRAASEFPALTVEVRGGGCNSTTSPEGTSTSWTCYSESIALRITNHERRREVHLDVRMTWVPSTRKEPYRFPARWQSDWHDPIGVQLRTPIAVISRGTVEGWLVFDYVNLSNELSDDRQLEIVDLASNRSVLVRRELGTVRDAT
jgi:hypothetical protein